MPPYFIAVAGNIGVGKSSLVQLLSQKLGWEPVLERVEDNPYLADFYQDMTRWAFHSQIFFLCKRLQQHRHLVQKQVSVFQDRTIYEDAEIFARNLYLQGAMNERDWVCYDELYRTVVALLPPPHLMIYLQASVPTLKRRITQRGRLYERTIGDDYLHQLNECYEAWAQTFTRSPLLTIQTDKLDYVQDEAHLEQIWQAIEHRLNGRDYLDLA